MSILSRFFGSKPPVSSVPHGRLIYAIGDVHGRADVLADLLATVKKDAEGLGASERELIFLGDYVDRGPDSRGVIEQILALDGEPGVSVLALKGNHEEAMLEFMKDASFGPVWAQHGGGATLRSYGVEPPANRMDDTQWQRAQGELAAAMPAEHKRFLEGLTTHCKRGDYVFVHAGIRPGVPLEEQTERDMLWIRREFLEHGKPLGHVVVHGHTPESQPFAGPHRIGVDTGAYYSGRLTAVRLWGNERSFVQAHGSRGESRHAISGFAKA